MSDGQEVEAWRHTQRHNEVIREVRARLLYVGGLTELRIIDGMSAQELDLLVERELR